VRGEKTLCQDLDISLRSGDVARVMGENGAGKSTLLKYLVGILTPEDGKIVYKDEDVSNYRDVMLADTLYLGHQSGIKTAFTVIENLMFYSPLSAKDELQRALNAMSLETYGDTPSLHLSAGQKRRVALARLWLTNTRIWILDEPFTALDVNGVAALENRINQHAQQGGITIFTSHQSPISIPSVKEIRLTP
jgi:heme exporter protein A